jgi:hypothetical protein
MELLCQPSSQRYDTFLGLSYFLILFLDWAGFIVLFPSVEQDGSHSPGSFCPQRSDLPPVWPLPVQA